MKLWKDRTRESLAYVGETHGMPYSVDFTDEEFVEWYKIVSRLARGDSK